MAHAATPGLEFWEPRRLTSLAAARDRVKFIERLRVGLIAVAVIAMTLLLLSAVLRGIERQSQKPREIAAEDIVRMVNPRFSGRNAKGRPYQVIAETAMRRKGDPNIIDLVSPVMSDMRGGTLSSATGIYNQEAKTIELTGKVKFNDKAGYSFDTHNSVVLLAESRVIGRAGVSGKGPLGAIQSNAYEIQNGGQTVIFSGQVRTRLKGRPAKAPQ
jgi:lipopolysaccharide export system protein LptC